MTSTEITSTQNHAPLRALSIGARSNFARHARRGGRGDPVLEFVVGDIIDEVADAIVNPAGAGLVDLSIRRAAGPELLEAFHHSASALAQGRLSPGRAIVTPGFDLAAGHVIHCGPPVYGDDPRRAREDLATCHVEALRLARERGFCSISFPAIGTGIYRYPAPEAAEIAVRTVFAELRAHGGPQLVRFVLFNPAMLRLYLEAARVRLQEDSTPDEYGTAFGAARAR